MIFFTFFFYRFFIFKYRIHFVAGKMVYEMKRQQLHQVPVTVAPDHIKHRVLHRQALLFCQVIRDNHILLIYWHVINICSCVNSNEQCSYLAMYIDPSHIKKNPLQPGLCRLLVKHCPILIFFWQTFSPNDVGLKCFQFPPHLTFVSTLTGKI